MMRKVKQRKSAKFVPGYFRSEIQRRTWDGGTMEITRTHAPASRLYGRCGTEENDFV